MTPAIADIALFSNGGRMTAQIGSTIVPDSLWQTAHAVKRRGGKVYLCTPAANEITEHYDLCSNCGGGGVLILQTVTGGPNDNARPGRANDLPVPETSTYINGKWFMVKDKGYSCPVCRQMVEL
jgi:hypothetical protein